MAVKTLAQRIKELQDKQAVIDKKKAAQKKIEDGRKELAALRSKKK